MNPASSEPLDNPPANRRDRGIYAVLSALGRLVTGISNAREILASLPATAFDPTQPYSSVEVEIIWEQGVERATERIATPARELQLSLNEVRAFDDISADILTCARRSLSILNLTEGSPASVRKAAESPAHNGFCEPRWFRMRNALDTLLYELRLEHFRKPFQQWVDSLSNDCMPSNDSIPHHWINAPEAAAKLGVTRQAVNKMLTGKTPVLAGKQQPNGHWRIDPESIDRYRRAARGAARSEPRGSIEFDQRKATELARKKLTAEP